MSFESITQNRALHLICALTFTSLFWGCGDDEKYVESPTDSNQSSRTPEDEGTATPNDQELSLKGHGITAYWQGRYQSPNVQYSIEAAAETGANALSILVTQYQDTLTSQSIYPTQKTPTDEDLIHVFELANQQGLKTVLKPHVDIQSDNSLWRGNIEQNNEDAWQAWFDSYERFILHYADLAEEHDVDMLIVGTELRKTVSQERHWRNIISNVREHFSGDITYSANHSGEETSIMWWDLLDVIGISAYYNLTDLNDPTQQDLKQAWQTNRDNISPFATLADLHQTFNKPIVFTEIGYRSSDGTNQSPWCHWCESNVDLKEQSDLWSSIHDVFKQQPWFVGVFNWGWDTEAEKSGPCDSGYSVYNKPAENVIRTWYGAAPKSGIETECAEGQP